MFSGDAIWKWIEGKSIHTYPYAHGAISIYCFAAASLCLLIVELIWVILLGSCVCHSTQWEWLESRCKLEVLFHYIPVFLWPTSEPIQSTNNSNFYIPYLTCMQAHFPRAIYLSLFLGNNMLKSSQESCSQNKSCKSRSTDKATLVFLQTK